MIPKIIHYVWVGGNPLPELAKKCIESWKKFCPDYEIKEWNESNFDINANLYCKQAVAEKKWAFVSDYIRLKVLYAYGGIYMDTDVEVVKNLDKFLKNKAFSGFEDDTHIPTGIMAAEKGNEWIHANLKYYDNAIFKYKNGTLNLTTNVETITRITKEKYPNLVLQNSKQDLGDVVFYPKDYFCPLSYATKELQMTKNTHTIHHFLGSWVPKPTFFGKIKNIIKCFIKKIIGKKNVEKIREKRGEKRNKNG